MQAHPLALGRGERSRLVPDRVGDAQAAEVVHQPRPAHERRVAGGQPVDASRPRARGRPPRASGRSSTGDFRSVKSAIASSADSSSVVGEHDLERRLRLDHRVPRRRRVDVVEQRAAPRRRTRPPAPGRTASRCARGRPRPPRPPRRCGGRSRPRPRASPAAPARRICSPLASAGTPLPSQRSKVWYRPSRTSAPSPSAAASSFVATQWFSIIVVGDAAPSAANLTPRRARSATPRPAPTWRTTNARAGTPAMSTWRASALSALSSPNHFACSYAST